MAKKKFKNPFTGQPADPVESESSSKPVDKMSMEELIKDLQDLEKEVGRKQFDRMLKEALKSYKESHKENFEIDEDEYDDFLEDDSVTVDEWTRTHPANLKCASDKYYADLANHLCEVAEGFRLPPSTPEGLTREIGKVLAAYLEDLVSGTRIFSAMRRVCRKRYGYTLPFYDCDHEDYFPDHINEEDIRFLIWNVVSRLGYKNEMTYSPLAPGWELMASRLFDELNSRFEEAPEATRVTDWLRRSFRKEDYIDIREMCTWLFFYHPLTYRQGYIRELLTQMELTAIKHDLEPERTNQIIYGLIACESWQRSMSAMGCPSKTLVASLSEEFGFESLATEIDDIEVLHAQVYAISRDRKTGKIIFETSSHRKLEVERNSFAKGFRIDGIQYAQCNLIRYKGKYLLNGLMTTLDDMKEIWETQPEYESPEQKLSFAREMIDKLDGRQVVCVSNLKNLLGTLGLPVNKDSSYPKAKNYIALVSKELGLAILPDMGYAFNLPNNRFYRKKRAVKESFADVVFQNAIPHDVAEYIQVNNLLPEAYITASQGMETGRKIVQDYLSFWIGFYCQLPAYGNVQKGNPFNDDEEDTDDDRED